MWDKMKKDNPGVFDELELSNPHAFDNEVINLIREMKPGLKPPERGGKGLNETNAHLIPKTNVKDEEPKRKGYTQS
jgi:hypothetical protein